jgi:hypothetical protein
MAGLGQQRGRGASAVNTPSASSDDGTLADAPLVDAPIEGADTEQHEEAHISSQSACIDMHSYTV